MPGVHARLSPSAAKRWINCTASVGLSDQFPDETSKFAAEGTAAHELAAEVLEKGGKAASRIGEYIVADDYRFEVDDEMAGHVQSYVDTIHSLVHDDALYVEQRMPYTRWVKDGYGTGDAVGFREDQKLCIVADLKYGKGVAVSAEDNPQLKLYALGAYQKFHRFYEIERFEIHVIQPRLDSHTSFRIELGELLAWAEETVQPAADAIYADKVEFNPGPWCTENFCPARFECRHRAKVLDDEALKDFEPIGDTLTGEELADIVALIPQVKSFMADMETAAKNRLLDGKEVPGFKLVEGRSLRQWKDASMAEEALRRTKLKVAQIYKRTLISPAQAETALGKKLKGTQQLMAKHVHKPRGKPALAPADSPKPEYQTATAESEFTDITDRQQKDK